MNEMISLNPAHAALLGALLMGLGKAFKEIPHFPNWIIPISLAVAGGVAAGLLDGFRPETVFVGVVAGLTSVGVHQTVRQITNKEDDKPQPPNPVAVT